MQTEKQWPKTTHRRLEQLMLKHEFNLSQKEMVRSAKSFFSAILLIADIIKQKKGGEHLGEGN